MAIYIQQVGNEAEYLMTYHDFESPHHYAVLGNLHCFLKLPEISPNILPDLSYFVARSDVNLGIQFQKYCLWIFFLCQNLAVSGVGNSMTHMENSLLLTVWSNSTFRLVSDVLIDLTFKFFCQPWKRALFVVQWPSAQANWSTSHPLW